MAKIVIVNGSAHKDSLNLRIAKFVEGYLKNEGVDVSLIHLGEEKLPPFEGYDVPYSERVNEILRLMIEAEGFYLVVPEYHRAVPSVLKNLFEYIDDDRIKINDRPAAIVTATVGQWGQWSQMTLLGTLRALHVWLLPDEMYISRATGLLDGNGEIKDEGVSGRLVGQIERFLKVVELLRPLRSTH